MFVQSSKEGLALFKKSLHERNICIKDEKKFATGDGFFHPQVITETGEIYHIKYTKNPYQPKESHYVSSGAKELDEKLKNAISLFGNGDNTIVGLNDIVILNLLNYVEEGHEIFFVTVIGDGRILWTRIKEFYEFVMRYDTFIKFARANVPQAMVPTGWLLNWANPIKKYPELIWRDSI